jgi:hypothetical protein
MGFGRVLGFEAPRDQSPGSRLTTTHEPGCCISRPLTLLSRQTKRGRCLVNAPRWITPTGKRVLRDMRGGSDYSPVRGRAYGRSVIRASCRFFVDQSVHD